MMLYLEWRRLLSRAAPLLLLLKVWNVNGEATFLVGLISLSSEIKRMELLERTLHMLVQKFVAGMLVLEIQIIIHNKSV